MLMGFGITPLSLGLAARCWTSTRPCCSWVRAGRPRRRGGGGASPATRRGSSAGAPARHRSRRGGAARRPAQRRSAPVGGTAQDRDGTIARGTSPESGNRPGPRARPDRMPSTQACHQGGVKVRRPCIRVAASWREDTTAVIPRDPDPTDAEESASCGSESGSPVNRTTGNEPSGQSSMACGPMAAPPALARTRCRGRARRPRPRRPGPSPAAPARSGGAARRPGAECRRASAPASVPTRRRPARARSGTAAASARGPPMPSTSGPSRRRAAAGSCDWLADRRVPRRAGPRRHRRGHRPPART